METPKLTLKETLRAHEGRALAHLWSARLGERARISKTNRSNNLPIYGRIRAFTDDFTERDGCYPQAN